MKAGDNLIRELAGVTFAPATWSKRFVRDIASLSPDQELTVRQEAAAWRLAYTFRRQLSRDLAAEALSRKVNHVWVEAEGGERWQCCTCKRLMFSERERNAPCPGPPEPKLKRDTKRKECNGKRGVLAVAESPMGTPQESLFSEGECE
jgi:hypothetical protein